MRMSSANILRISLTFSQWRSAVRLFNLLLSAKGVADIRKSRADIQTLFEIFFFQKANQKWEKTINSTLMGQK